MPRIRGALGRLSGVARCLNATPCRRTTTTALARWLAAKGHEAEHVGDKGMQAASDTAIWNYALASSAAIVTKDEDFTQRKVLTATGPVVVWIRLPNTRRRDLLIWFEAVLPDVVAAIRRGETLIEVV